MPRHPHCLRASAAFWPVNSDTPQPDHPVLAPDPFTKTHYDTENIQVPEADVTIPAVCLPAGVQVWKGIAHSVATANNYLHDPGQTYTPVEGLQFNHGGFYGSSDTAVLYSEVKRTKEETPGIDLSFVTRHGLKLIDIGNVQTANAICELINTVTPEKVACDPRYTYFLEMMLGVVDGTDNSWYEPRLKYDEEAIREKLADVPLGDVTAVAMHLCQEDVNRRYHEEDGTEYSPLDVFGLQFESREVLTKFLMNYDKFQHLKKSWQWGRHNQTLKLLFKFYTYQLSDQNVPLQDQAEAICDSYFDIKKHGFNQSKLEQLTMRLFFEFLDDKRSGSLAVVQKTLAQSEKKKRSEPEHKDLIFQTSYRHSEDGFDILLVLLLERFVAKFCYFDGWIYIRDKDVEHTNINTMTRSLNENVETSPTQNEFHSEIYLTDQGKAKIDYVGYNRFDA